MAMQPGKLDELAGRLYDAAVDPAMWNALLTDLADAAGGNGACHMVSDVVSGASTVSLSRYTDGAVLAPFHAHYAGINPLLLVDDLAAYQAAYRPSMLRDEDWIGRQDMERTEYFNDFLRPIDACRGLFLRLRLNGRMLTSISISRGRGQEHFGTAEMACLGSLHRHAIRAVALGHRFADLGGFVAGATMAIDAVDDPLLMLDAERRVVHLNPAAERLVTAGTLLGVSFGRLTTASQRSGALLARAIEQAAAGDQRVGESLSLASGDGREAARADILPIGVDAATDVARGPAVLIRITPLRRSDTVAARLAALELTRAEQSLVILLLEGRTLRDAAAVRAISFNTARRHLASVFDKTGVHRQSELLRLLIR